MKLFFETVLHKEAFYASQVALFEAWIFMRVHCSYIYVLSYIYQLFKKRVDKLYVCVYNPTKGAF